MSEFDAAARQFVGELRARQPIPLDNQKASDQASEPAETSRVRAAQTVVQRKPQSQVRQAPYRPVRL